MNYKILDVKEQLLEENDILAASNRKALQRNGTLLINLMGSPGAGKTSVLLRLIAGLKDEFRIGVMEADVDSDVDAKAVSDAGAKAFATWTPP